MLPQTLIAMPSFTRPQRRSVIVYTTVIVLLLLITAVLPATGALRVPHTSAQLGKTRAATVLRVNEEARQPTDQGVAVTERIDVLLDGNETQITRTRIEGTLGSIAARPGDEVLVTSNDTPAGTTHFIVDRVRRMPLWTISLIFLGTVLAVGGWSGARALVGLAASVAVVVRFIIPAILAGWNPLLVSVSGALVVMMTALFISHGVDRKTLVALAGTAGALLITALLAWFSIGLARLTGLATDDATVVQILSSGTIDVRGLLLGGIIIGALGVLDDVTIAQASAVFELHEVNRRLSGWPLYRRAMNIGRDHIASTVNTLVLAYAGGALPLLVILAAQAEPLGILANREALATEIVRTLVGSVGLIAAVPLTTAIAAIVASRDPQPPVPQRSTPPTAPSEPTAS